MQLFRSLIIITVLFSLLIACNNESQKDSSPIPKVMNTDFRKLDTALFFAGLWVNEQYINDVKNTRSPINVQVPENACIIMPAKTLKQTSLILGFHEGQEVTILKNGNNYEIWDQNAENKLQDIVLLGENKMKLGFDTFIKLQSGDVSAEKNPYNIVDILLFAGKYHDEHGNTVDFSNEGKVKGIPGINVYEAQLDYATSEAIADQVSLGASLSTMKDYAFQFDKDTLKIFHIKCVKMGEDSVCVESVVGARYLTLVKEK